MSDELDSSSDSERELSRAELARVLAETKKFAAEAQKASAESEQTRPVVWALRTLIPTIVAAFAAGLASFWFSDSLLERTRAEIRRDVLKTYFSVENTGAGKRTQILGFVEKVAKQDPVLLEWVNSEKKAVQEAQDKVSAETESREREVRSLREKYADTLNARRELLDQLMRADLSESWLSEPVAGDVSLPGPLSKFMSAEMQSRLLELYKMAEPMGLPGGTGCDEFQMVRDALLREEPIEVGYNSDMRVPTRDEVVAFADRCRTDLIDWVNVTASGSASKMSERMGPSIERYVKSAGRSIASDQELPEGEAPG